MDPLTLLTYCLAAFVITVFCRSIFPAYFILVLFHWVFWFAVFGIGLLTDLEYHVCYPLVYALWTVVGWVFFCAFGHTSLFLLIKCPRYGLGYALRMIVALLLFIIVPLPLEFIDHWAGGIVAIILVIVAVVACYFLLVPFCVFQFNPIKVAKKIARASGCGAMAGAPLVATGHVQNRTIDFCMYMAIVYLPTVAIFWIVWIWFEFSQMCLMLIVGAIYIVFFLIAKFVWLRVPGRGGGMLSKQNVPQGGSCGAGTCGRAPC